MFHTNEEWTERILGRRTAVSDTVQFTASSAPESCIDPDHGMIYTTYLASRENYGESRNIVALARIPVCQPERTKTWVVAESGMEIDGKKYGEFLDNNCYYFQTNEEAATVVTHFGQTGTLYRGYVRVLEPALVGLLDYDPVRARVDEVRIASEKLALVHAVLGRRVLAQHGGRHEEVHDEKKDELRREVEGVSDAQQHLRAPAHVLRLCDIGPCGPAAGSRSPSRPFVPAYGLA